MNSYIVTSPEDVVQMAEALIERIVNTPLDMNNPKDRNSFSVVAHSHALKFKLERMASTKRKAVDIRNLASYASYKNHNFYLSIEDFRLLQSYGGQDEKV